MGTFIYANKGASGSYPENTMKAFEQAVKAGADGISFNVQLSKDAIPVIIHDRTVNRTTNGQGPVRQYTARELKQLNAAEKQTYQSRESIPLLAELLDWVNAHQTLQLNMEIIGYGFNHNQLIKSIFPLINHPSIAERLIISSFDHMLLARIKEAFPLVEIAALVEGTLWNSQSYLQGLGARAYHIKAGYATRELVIDLQNEGIHVRTLTTNDTASLKQFFSWGTSGVFTDFPARAVHLRDNG